MPEPRTKSLAANAALLAIGSAFTQASALLTTVALARMLSKPEFAGFQQLFLLYALISPLLLAGVPAGLLYFMAGAEKDEGRRWVLCAYVVLAVLGVVFSAAVAIGHNFIAEEFNNDALSTALLVFAPYPLLLFVAAVMPNALVVTGRAGLAAALNALGAVVFVVAVLVAAAITRDAHGTAVGLLVTGAFTCVLSVFAVARWVGIASPRSFSLARGKRLLGYGLPLALTGLASTLGFQFDRLVVSARFTPAEFAVYAVGAVEVPIAALVQQSVNNVLAPALTVLYRNKDIPGLVSLWHAAIRKTSLVLLPVFAFLLVAATALIEFLFGTRYHGSIEIFRVYLFLMPLRVATYGLIPMAIGRTGINLSASLVLLVVNAVLVLVLVGPLGLVGAALGTVIATTTVAAYYLVRLRRILELPISALFPWRLLLVNLLLSLVAALPALPFFLLDLAPGVALVAGTLVYGVSYVVLMRRTGRIDDDDWQRMGSTMASTLRVLRRRPGPEAG